MICLCKDNVLKKKMAQIYGKDSFQIATDFQVINQSDLSKCTLLIVDLKDCLLPNKTFFSPILALSQLPSFEEALAVLKCGAKGYGNRHMRASNLQQAIESVLAGQIWLPPSIVTKLIDKVEIQEGSTMTSKKFILEKLSTREQEVASCVAQGMSNQQIADKLFISLRTVKSHLTSIYNTTGLQNRLELGLQLKG